MSSFKEVRELLLVAYDSEIINDEEFLVLFENYRSRNPQFPYNSYPRFELLKLINNSLRKYKGN